MVKKLFAFLITLLLVSALTVTAFAHPVPDLSKNGSITFVMDWNGELLDSGSLNLSQIGQVAENDGNYSFALIEALAGSDLSLESLEDPLLAEELLTLAKVMELDKITAPIEEGAAVFQDLAPGLYVVWQDEADASQGFAAISPFLISMPKYQNGEYVLDVIANPKVPLETAPPTTQPPGDPSLPQTGQLNWPVPVLAISGAVLFIFGFVLWTGRKRV